MAERVYRGGGLEARRRTSKSGLPSWLPACLPACLLAAPSATHVHSHLLHLLRSLPLTLDTLQWCSVFGDWRDPRSRKRFANVSLFAIPIVNPMRIERIDLDMFRRKIWGASNLRFLAIPFKGEDAFLAGKKDWANLKEK